MCELQYSRARIHKLYDSTYVLSCKHHEFYISISILVLSRIYYCSAQMQGKIYEFHERLYSCVVKKIFTHHKSGVTIKVKLQKLSKGMCSSMIVFTSMFMLITRLLVVYGDAQTITYWAIIIRNDQFIITYLHVFTVLVRT